MQGTLNELSQLQRSQFGQPEPRHGLRLLFWFANEFIEFDSNVMVATEHPNTAAFGFHPFHNRPDHNGDTLLPETESSDFYEVGNLNETNAYQFPAYVREDYTGLLDGSNTDRIIVDMDGCNVYKVYVTSHSDQSNFSSSETYRISQGLISIISRMTLEDFLSKMNPPKPSTGFTSYNMYQPKHFPVLQPGNRGMPMQPSLSQLGNTYAPPHSSVSQPHNRDPPKQAPVLQVTTPKQSAVSQPDNRERQKDTCEVTIDNGVIPRNDSWWKNCIIL
ncbi:uncharacterized protein LOC134435510 [Engraulis encrasicolus]|uniref:uncharacterized protein LOC134435510 n=1 Tax=Engraulis encrasicolus TaxID=184585 RepID=UPI002FD41FEC